MILSSLPRLWEKGIPREGEDVCWLGEVTVLRITTHYTLSTLLAKVNGHFIVPMALSNFKTQFAYRKKKEKQPFPKSKHTSLLAQYCAGDKIEKNEMGRACGAYG